MKKENNRIFVHERILQKIQEDCIQLSKKKRFTFKELSFLLEEFIVNDLKKLSSGLYFRYNINNNSDKGLSPTTVAHAWKCEGKEYDGASKDFRDLLCYFSFKNDWVDTLKELNINLEKEIQRTNEKKEEFKSIKEGIPYISKVNSEIKKFANNIYIELITRKAGIPIDEKNDVIEELYNTWYKLFCIIRDEIKALPISCIKDQSNPESAQNISIKILNDILRPHLTEYQARFRRWFEKAKQNPEYKELTPQELQRKYPDYKILIKSLIGTNEMLIDSAKKLFELIK